MAVVLAIAIAAVPLRVAGAQGPVTVPHVVRVTVAGVGAVIDAPSLTYATNVLAGEDVVIGTVRAVANGPWELQCRLSAVVSGAEVAVRSGTDGSARTLGAVDWVSVAAGPGRHVTDTTVEFRVRATPGAGVADSGFRRPLPVAFRVVPRAATGAR